MIRQTLAAFLVILVTAPGAISSAADCGDKAGGGGTRVACACGDTVITNTSLRANDPVVTTVCPGLGLSIGADHVALNCNGREISGDPSDDGIAVVGRTGVTVRGCTITGFARGLVLSASSGNTLLSNSIGGTLDHGIALEDGSTANVIKANRVVGPGNDAINLGAGSGGNMIVTNILDASGSLADGIDIDDVDAGGNTIKGNQVIGFSVGIEVSSTGNVITQNTANDNFNQGILVFESPNTITSNTTDGNLGEGILVSGDGNTIDGNRGRLNDFNALVVNGNENVVARNTADGNGFEGIAVDG